MPTRFSYDTPVFDAHGDRIAEFLATHGEATLHEIHAALDIPKSSVRNIVLCALADKYPPGFFQSRKPRKSDEYRRSYYWSVAEPVTVPPSLPVRKGPSVEDTLARLGTKVRSGATHV